MESFISKDELARLSKEELVLLQENIEDAEAINKVFSRSQYYPFSRNLCFPSEIPLLKKWGKNKQNLVEIGVFEGASALTFRSVMSPRGTLNLIDPFVKVPDSGLVARYWMARLNLLRSRRGEVKWYRDYSYNIAKQWSESIDLLFIDGDHAEVACRRDWEDWHKYIIVGGIVIFHDARFGKSSRQFWDGWPGPTKVVDELFRGPNKIGGWEIVDEAGTLVVVKRLK